MENKLLNVTQVALIVDASVQTIGSWYRWKNLHPDHEMAKLLPDYIKMGNKHTRYWKEGDVWKILEFKNSLPQGRYGILGDVTQKYVKTNFRNKKTEE